jgi:hypothetical protein
MSEQGMRRVLHDGNTSRRIWLQPAWSNGQGFAGLKISDAPCLRSRIKRVQLIGGADFLTMFFGSQHRRTSLFLTHSDVALILTGVIWRGWSRPNESVVV